VTLGRQARDRWCTWASLTPTTARRCISRTNAPCSART
jgi:hypothetical protein